MKLNKKEIQTIIDHNGTLVSDSERLKAIKEELDKRGIEYYTKAYGEIIELTIGNEAFDDDEELFN